LTIAVARGRGGIGKTDATRVQFCRDDASASDEGAAER
jgi:hypothetical protein